MSNENKAYSDRSRCITHHSCPRRRWWEYEHPTSGKVGGIQSSRLDMNLLGGSAFHAGIQHLLTGAMSGHYDPHENPNWVEDAVRGALEGRGGWPGYWPLAKSRGLILEDNEDASYVAYEQGAMIEALIRGYEKFCLPQLLERYEVVEVEREDLGEFLIPELPFTLQWGMRGDALLMERGSMDLYILSLKTAKEHGKREEASARHDMQGLSETATVEHRLGKWHQQLNDAKANLSAPGPGTLGIPEWFVTRYLEGASPNITGVKMEYAIKGKRSEYPRGSGRYTFSNPLIRPWKHSDDLPTKRGKSQHLDIPYAFMYDFQDAMGGNHRLGKGWNRINIWEDIGVKEWVNILHTNSLQGFDPGRGIASQFILPMEYNRNEEDMERWKRQVVHQEWKVRQGRAECLNILQKNPKNFERALDEHFPMHTRSCDWPTRCQFQEICFGPKAYLYDPMSSGIYDSRIANHQIEEELGGEE